MFLFPSIAICAFSDHSDYSDYSDYSDHSDSSNHSDYSEYSDHSEYSEYSEYSYHSAQRPLSIFWRYFFKSFIFLFSSCIACDLVKLCSFASLISVSLRDSSRSWICLSILDVSTLVFSLLLSSFCPTDCDFDAEAMLP